MKLKSKHIPGGVQDHLPHSPVDEKTLKDSLTKMLGTTKSLPDISEGYKVWKEVFDTGQGGVFNIPISQILEYIEDTLNQ